MYQCNGMSTYFRNGERRKCWSEAAVSVTVKGLINVPLHLFSVQHSGTEAEGKHCTSIMTETFLCFFCATPQLVAPLTVGASQKRWKS